MKNYALYSLFIALLLQGCDAGIGNDRSVITHKKVFVLYDTLMAETEGKQTICPNADTSYLEYVFGAYDLVNIRSLDSTVEVDLKYAGTDNFMKTNFYDGLRHAYFPCEVALCLCKAQYYLKAVDPQLSLVIFDAARPLHIQQMMWDSLKMPEDRKFNYLAPPYEISLHNYGCAVDLSIIDKSQNLLMDMGSAFDTFEKISQPVYEQKFLASGELSQQAFRNRQLLRQVMKRAGFNAIPSEWWHFGYGNKNTASSKFKLIK